MVPPFGLFSAQKDEAKEEHFFQDIRYAWRLSNISMLMDISTVEFLAGDSTVIAEKGVTPFNLP